jgi:16S rRNA (cytosine967-C5)-methyltransferase
VKRPAVTAPGFEPRRAAYDVLEQVRAGLPFEVALDRAVKRLTEPDRRLAHELAAGVLRSQTALDDSLAPLVPGGWASVAPELKHVLRLGAFQLTALDRVPPHAAVDTSVALAKAAVGARAGGFVNAVLRRLGRSEPSETRPESSAEGLARAASHPPWLVKRWLERFGHEETVELLRWNNTRPRLVLQPAREPQAALEARWREAGIDVTEAPFGAGLVTDRRRPQDLPGYEVGAFIVQDPAHALVVRYADLPAVATLYDACAAPGGKTIAFGRGLGRVIAGDLGQGRVRRLATNLRRAGSGREHPIVADARAAPLRGVDAVLIDAPCLGTGTLARHPDARWRITPDALTMLQRRQADLLDGAADAVASGGWLIYATCSIEPEENGEQVDAFLRRHPEFRREPGPSFPAVLTSSDGDLMILPQRHQMGGAYAARLRRAR